MQLTHRLQQQVHLLASGSHTAGLSMLQHLLTFLQSWHTLHTNSTQSAAQGIQSQQGSAAVAASIAAAVAASIAAAEASAADEFSVASVLHVLTVLVAHDKTCRDAIANSWNADKPPTQVHSHHLTSCLL